MQQRLNIITLGVKDLEKSLAFYEGGLNWERSSASQGDIVFFNLGGIVLALYPLEELAKDANTTSEGNGFRGFTLAYNTQSEQEVDEVLKLAKKAGATIAKPAEKAFWGGYSGYFKDPDGFLIEVAYNPFTELNDQGALMM